MVWSNSIINMGSRKAALSGRGGAMRLFAGVLLCVGLAHPDSLVAGGVTGTFDVNVNGNIVNQGGSTTVRVVLVQANAGEDSERIRDVLFRAPAPAGTTLSNSASSNGASCAIVNNVVEITRGPPRGGLNNGPSELCRFTLTVATDASAGPRDVWLAADVVRSCSTVGGESLNCGLDPDTFTVRLSGQYTVGGTISGLTESGLRLSLNSGAQTFNAAAGATLFSFGTPLNNGANYSVTIAQQPTGQVCAVTNGSGTISSSNVTDVQVACTTNQTIGGSVTGLAGGSVTLLLNGGSPLVRNANGNFSFPTAQPQGSGYAVTVGSNPTSPPQTCTVTNGSGTVGATPITNVAVNCTTSTYTVGGTVVGLAGSGLVLRNNNTNDLSVSNNGNFTFTTPIASGQPYAVTVQTQPGNPTQSCVVTNGAGTIGTANVTNVSVNCTTTAYTISAAVSGLPVSQSVVLQNNGGNNLTVNANGTATFATAVPSGQPYNVTVLTQPAGANCVVTNPSGFVGSTNVTVSVTCTAGTFTVGGTVSGLVGTGLVLRNNGGNDLAIASDGSFTFTTPIASGQSYAVTVFSAPSTPTQVCAVTNGSGTVTASNVTNVLVTCQGGGLFTIGGTVTGLVGTGLVLQNNGGNNLAIAANGSFTFTTALADGAAYAVTVLSNPSNPTQSCTATNASGNVPNANVTNVSVTCTTTSFTIGAAVTGLLAGQSVVLQNNGGNNLTVNANGTSQFSTPISSGQPYSVTVLTQPAGGNCVVTNGSGFVGSANVTVDVACASGSFTIGGTVTGLVGTGLVLQNNGGNNLSILSNGSFTFTTAIASGQPYSVTVLTNPSSPTQVCSVTNGSGTVGASNVNNVQVNCPAAGTFTVGGAITGLVGAGLQLSLNGGASSVSPNAGATSYSFALALANGSAYSVAIIAQPAGQSCTIANGSGTVSSVNVTNANVSCVSASSYTVSGSVAGLTSSGLQLALNGANLIPVASGATTFTFPISLSGVGYSVTVATQPTGLFCSVANGTGSAPAAGSNVTNVAVTCGALAANILPNPLDLGLVHIGTGRTEDLRVVNPGAQPLLISAFTQPLAPFSVIGGTCLPLPRLLFTGDECTFTVRLAAQGGGQAVLGSMTVTTTASAQPAVVELRGGTFTPIPVNDPRALLLLVLVLLTAGAVVLRNRGM